MSKKHQQMTMVENAAADPMAAEFMAIVGGAKPARGEVADPVPDAVRPSAGSGSRQFSELDARTKQKLLQQQSRAEAMGDEAVEGDPSIVDEPVDADPLGNEPETELEVAAPVAADTSDKELRVLRARLIANDMDPDAVDEMSPAVVRAVAASIGSRTSQNTVAPQSAGNPETGVEPSESEGPLVSPAVLKEISAHFDGDVAATLGKAIESSVKPLYESLRALRAENAELRQGVTQSTQSRQAEAVESARASLVDSFPELKDNAVYSSLQPYLQGLASSVYKDKPMTPENLRSLISASARAQGLREVTAESRAAETGRRVAKTNGQPMKGGPQGRSTVSKSAADEAAWRGIQLHMKGRAGDAQAVWNAMQS